MGVLRILLILMFAAFLAGCTSTTQQLEAQGYLSPNKPQAERALTAEARPEAKKPRPPTPALATATTASDKTATTASDKTATTASDKAATTTSGKAAPTASDKNKVSATTPKTGSPEWEKEAADNDRKEKRLKQVIEGICRGC